MKIKAEDLLQTLAWAGAEEIYVRRKLRTQWWRPTLNVIPYGFGRFRGMGPRYLAEWVEALRNEISARRERGQW